MPGDWSCFDMRDMNIFTRGSLCSPGAQNMGIHSADVTLYSMQPSSDLFLAHLYIYIYILSIIVLLHCSNNSCLF